MEMFTPVPDEELMELLHVSTSIIGRNAFLGGCLGALAGAAITYVPSVITYPLNVGGRPLNSWPAFAVIIFELAILFSAFAAVGTLIYVNAWPRFDRSIFSLEEFCQRKDEHYFLLLEEELKDVKADRAYHLRADAS